MTKSTIKASYNQSIDSVHHTKL